MNLSRVAVFGLSQMITAAAGYLLATTAQSLLSFIVFGILISLSALLLVVAIDNNQLRMPSQDIQQMQSPKFPQQRGLL